ncbi:MAG: ABC transporter ATP-binding protein/permease [Lachnospiraceae bacterium]|nr:ABC transporter ATP-binding protein/permease [Lachnospiraceae bacterium]
MKKTMTDLKSNLRLLLYAFGFILNDGKPYFLLTFLKAAISVLALICYTLLPGFIINELIAQDITKTVLYAVLLVSATFLQTSINAFLTVKADKRKLVLRDQLGGIFFRQVVDMDYASFESPDILHMKEHADNALDSVFTAVDSLAAIFSAVISFAIVFSVVAAINPLMIVFILGVVWINSGLTKRLNVRIYETNLELDNYWLTEWAADFQMNDPSFAKEIRVFDIGGMLIDNWKTVRQQGNVMKHKKVSDTNKTSFYQAIVNLCKDIVLYAYSIFAVLTGRMAVGTMSIYISAANQFSSNLGNVVKSYLNISRVCMNIRDLKKFMDLPTAQEKAGTETPKFDRSSTIEFRNVSFQYPGSDRYALHNVNLTIHGDERLCIVGENGSGKSTFIKLLTGLYEPTEGEILLNGRKVPVYDHKAYQRLFSPAFQEFDKFYLSLGKNITLDREVDQAKLDRVCRQLGLSSLVEKLQNGYDTPVEKLTDMEGINPSGGELQKISIARAVYSDREIYVLDEPTAALDPLAEYELYTKFQEIIAGKCAVLITHRLSAVQLADRVAVFSDGGIVGCGTHQELYANGGLYQEMFDKQSEFYIKAKEQ